MSGKKRIISEILSHSIEEIAEVIGERINEGIDKLDLGYLKPKCGKRISVLEKCNRNSGHTGHCSILSEKEYERVVAELEIKLGGGRHYETAEKKKSFREVLIKVALKNECDTRREFGTIEKGIGTTLNLNGGFTLKALKTIVEALELIAKD